MAGLGSFMQGAMQGYAFASDVKDNKRRQKIEDQQLEREAERHGWAGENHKMSREINAHNLDTSRTNQSQAQKKRDREAAERQRKARIFAETEEQYKARQGGRGRSVIPADVTGGAGHVAVDGGMGADDLEAIRMARSDAANPGSGPYSADGVNIAPNRARGIMYDQNGGQVIDQTPNMRSGPGGDTRPGMVQPGAPMQVGPDGMPVNAPRSGGDPLEADAARIAAIMRELDAARGGPVNPANPGPQVKDNVRQQQAQMVQNPGRMGGYMDQDQSGIAPSASDQNEMLRAPQGMPQQPSRGLDGYVQKDAPAAPPGPNAGNQYARDVDPNSSAFMQDVQGVMRGSDIEIARREIAQSLTGTAPASRAISSVTDYFTKSPEEGQAAQADRKKRADAVAWYRGPESKQLFSENPLLLNEAEKDPVGFFDRMQGNQGDPGTTGAPTAPGVAPVPAGSGPSVEAAAAATQSTVTKTPPKTNSRGITKATPAQEDRASKTFLEFYAENAVPKIVRGYLEQGNIEKAQAFTDWSESVQTKRQMKSWSKAVFSASIGDENGLLDHLGDTYNSFDDGFELVRAESGFTRADDGTILGANLTFKDTGTGETFVREYEDQGDLIEQGIYALAPENVFELLYEQTLAARKLEAGNSGRKIIDDRKDDIVAEAGRLRKQFLEQTMYGGQDQTMPTDDELFAMARDNISRAESLAAGRGSQAVAPQPVPDWGG